MVSSRKPMKPMFSVTDSVAEGDDDCAVMKYEDTDETSDYEPDETMGDGDETSDSEAEQAMRDDGDDGDVREITVIDLTGDDDEEQPRFNWENFLVFMARTQESINREGWY